MKVSYLIFVLVGLIALFNESKGNVGVVAHAATVIGLAIIGSFLLMKGY